MSAGRLLLEVRSEQTSDEVCEGRLRAGDAVSWGEGVDMATCCSGRTGPGFGLKFVMFAHVESFRTCLI